MEVEKLKQKSVVEPDLIPVQPLKLDSPIDGFLGSRFLQIAVTLGLLIILFAVSFFLAVRGKQMQETSPEDLKLQPIPTAVIKVEPTTATENLHEALCLESGGKWLEEFEECESQESDKGLSQEQCEADGGVYRECNSACRHSQLTPPPPCTGVCVKTCTFN